MTAVSRKVYRALALKFDRMRPGPGAPGEAYEVWESMVMGTLNVISESNPSFDRERFLTACGHDPAMWWEAHRESTRSAQLSRR